MQAIGYVRVSTDRQAEQGVSLEAQESRDVTGRSRHLLGPKAALKPPTAYEQRLERTFSP
jgi:hypothetical protein